MSTSVAKSKYTTIEAAGREVQLSSPDKVFFPKPGFTKLDLAEYYLAVAGGGGQPAARAAGDDEAIRRRDRWRVLLPETGSEGSAGLVADRDLHLPQRAHRDRARRQRCGAPGVGGQPRRRRLQPAPGSPVRPRLSRRAPRRPRPDARSALEHGPQGRDVRQGRARGAQPGRLSEDLGLARDPRQRPDRASLGLRRCTPCRAGPRPGGRTAAATERHQQVVEGGAPRRLRRLQPERAGPDDRRGLLRAAGAGCASLLPG